MYSRESVAVFGHECGDVQHCLSTLGLALLGSIGLVLHVVFGSTIVWQCFLKLLTFNKAHSELTSLFELCRHRA